MSNSLLWEDIENGHPKSTFKRNWQKRDFLGMRNGSIKKRTKVSLSNLNETDNKWTYSFKKVNKKDIHL